MKPWKMFCTGLAPLAFLASAAMGQGLPAITPPPGVAIAPQPPPVNAPVPPAALPPNIWDKLVPRADQCAACKAKICNSRIGQMLNNMLQPAGALTGGIIGPCCPTINAADLAKPPDSAEGAAARLKLDEADAANRKAAIRYMAGADCHYWPEVTEALIGSLRADRNECVRLEAALALGRGCCCNRATMRALTITVAGSAEDGNPPEDSDRVKMAALAALNNCLANYTEVVPAPEPVKTDHGVEPIPPRGEPVPPPAPTEVVPPPAPKPGAAKRPYRPTEYYHHAENLEEKSVVEAARRAAAHVTPVAAEAPSLAADHSLFGIARAAMTPPPAPVVQAAVVERAETHNAVVPAAAVQAPKPTPTPAPPVAAPAGVTPAGYYPPTYAPAPAPAKPAPAPQGHTSSASLTNTIAVLHDSIDPQEREKAAEELGACDGWTNPKVVTTLIEAARTDAAPIVRAACLRSLAHMNVRTLPVATVAQALKADPDPRVRSEADQTLQKIGGASRSQ